MEFPNDQYIIIQGIKIRYWQVGASGPYLVLLHGIAACIEYWHSILPELAKHYRVIALDFPGFGKSDKSTTITYDLSFYSDFLATFLATFSIETMYLVAHSLGSAIALQYTINHPSRVKKLTIVDGVGFSTQVVIFFRLMGRPFIGRVFRHLPKWLFSKALKANVYHKTVITEALINVLYPLAQNDEVRNTIAAITKINTNWCGIKPSVLSPLWSAYPLLQPLPVQVFWGKQDFLLKASVHVPVVKKFLPHAQIELFDECGHIPYWEYPAEFVARLRSFLNEESYNGTNPDGFSLPPSKRNFCISS